MSGNPGLSGSARPVSAAQKSAEGIVVGSLMQAKRQNIQLELALGAVLTGEARSAAAEGTEVGVARAASEPPAIGQGPSMEMVIEPGNVKKALARVRRNKGAPGIDGMRVEDLGAHLQGHWPEIRSLLLSGTYTPQAVRQVEIPKASGGVRALGVPTVVDRFIQQAVMQVLQREWDPGFSDSSYGFRPGRSAHQAVKRAQDHIRAGFGIVVDLDLEKFFDQVCHDIVMGLVAKRVSDRRLLRVIRGFLSAGALAGGLVSPRVEGTPQGGPLSPLLSNLMLDVVDKELESRGHRFVRYADDCNIYVRSRRAGERVMASVTGFLARRLRLRVNAAKSAVARPARRSFLGFSFTVGGRAKLRLAPQALARFKSRVRKLTRGTKRVSLPRLVSELSRYLVGWRGYFGFCETPSVLRSLDQWIRRRLRAAVWRQWKRGRRRFAALRRLGVGKDLAAKTAGSPCGPWRLSNSPALSIGLSNAFFIRLGLIPLIGSHPAA